MFHIAVRHINLLLTFSGKYFQGVAVVTQTHGNRQDPSGLLITRTQRSLLYHSQHSQ